MTVRNFNNVTTIGTLVAPVAASAVSLSVQNFNQAPSVPYTVTLDRNLATEEICLVTAQAGGALTVVRGYDGSAAQSHTAGATIEHTAGAIEYAEANSHVNATVGVHGVTGSLVGAEGAQTLFDKTLVAPLVQADVADGDAVVAYDPTGTRNLFRGMNQSGTDVITVDNTGKVNAAALAVAGVSTLTGALNANGGVSTTTLAASGAVTASGTVGVTGLLTASGGITVPTGKVVTVTDAPAVGTSAANKTYVDGMTWPTSALSDAASAATVNVVVKRDAAGRAQVADPAVAADIATKHYVDARAVTPDSGWTNVGTSPAFQNGWVNYTPATGFTPARFRKLSSGQVELQGLVMNGTNGTTIFTLPVGYRPGFNAVFIGQMGTNTAARFDVYSTGFVVAYGSTDNRAVSINCTFYAEG